jgi:uncharacterized protein YpuA (DUF1002 family)
MIDLNEYRVELNEDFTQMMAQLRFALDNLNDISKRAEVQGRIENVYFILDELCEQTKGEAE